MINKIKEHISQQIVDALENENVDVNYKSELAQKAGVSLTTLFAIIGNKSDYTFESLLKVYLALGFKIIPIWPL